MEVKKDILWRVYLSYIIIAVVCVVIIGKAVYIQQFQGKYWRSMGDSLHQRIKEVDADRGTIYSEDGQMLSTSIPQFDVFIDFKAEGLREKSGKKFRDNLDSLSMGLSKLFNDRSTWEYKKILQQGYSKNSDRHFLLQKNITYREYQQLMKLPLVRLGKNKSGVITEDKSIRLNPYKLLAYRTIGLDRENAQKIGLEKTYDSVLKGRSGSRLERYIAGGVSVPVDDYQVEPENGKDIVTTLDVYVQEIAENALMKMMVQNEAEHGCAIIMEVKTGKVKAIANLGKGTDGGYYEDFNYAINASEPGSTFKLATMIALLEDKKTSLSSIVNLEGGTWQVFGSKVFDSEQHGRTEVTVKQAFEYSSNVGMAKLALAGYGNSPSQFIRRLHEMRLDTLTGIDITGERNSVIYKPGSKYWSAITLPWMAFGYNIMVTPLQTATLYNAIANNGKMMKPYLVNAIKDQGAVIKEFKPTVLSEKICDENTLKQVKECLDGVCNEPSGTAFTLFKGSLYRVAGKTGTALVADANTTYADRVYQTSFAGYFPANDPQYTCVVVIRNKKNAVLHYGASVAGPVFKEIADRLYTTYVKQGSLEASLSKKPDSANYATYAGGKDDIKLVMSRLQMRYSDSGNLTEDWAVVINNRGVVSVSDKKISDRTMPQLKGLGMKDVVYLCENMGLRVNIKGKGKVISQSLPAGQLIGKGQAVDVQLN